MKKTYLNQNPPLINYDNKSTYIEIKDEINIIRDYEILPEEYDVFSALDIDFLKDKETEQIEFLNNICENIRTTLKLIYHRYGILKDLPKLELSVDIDGALILDWTYTLYRIYFDIERDTKKSFYGLVIKESESSIQTKTEILTKENCAEITGQIIQYIFN